MRSRVPIVMCQSCGREYPEDSEGSEELCGGCYEDEYCFTCVWCEECADKEGQHDYVVVFDAWEADVKLPGLYRVTGVPYYSQSMLGGGMLFSSCIQWLGFLPEMDDEGYACGHLCKGCQARALAWIEKDRLACMMFAALK